MTDTSTRAAFRSELGALMAELLKEKRLLGYKYQSGEVLLHNLDRFLADAGLAQAALPRELAERWAKRKANERASSHAARVGFLRRFATFLHRRGMEAHLIEPVATTQWETDFAPFIFTRAQMRAMFAAVDKMPPVREAPGREYLLPFLFRLLYCCGLRIGEALRLELRDVDVERGILHIREGKFRYDRLVPLSAAMHERLKVYLAMRYSPQKSVYLFPSRYGGAYSQRSVCWVFRRLLFASGIGYGGRGRGPRLHDLRHTFAVHRLEHWYRQGGNLANQLPALSAYMGHRSLFGTQRYLRITSALFPDIASRMDAFNGWLIPRRVH